MVAWLRKFQCVEYDSSICKLGLSGLSERDILFMHIYIKYMRKGMFFCRKKQGLFYWQLCWYA